MAERQFSKKYSSVYDALYCGKDYKKEARFIERIIARYSKIGVSKILSLGCGTCGHDILLAKKGYSITGLDFSADMLRIAKDKIKKARLSDKIKLYKKDIKNFSLPHVYDFAIAMFNVVGYLTLNEDFEGMLKGLGTSLRSGGLFIFDCWHAPAVISCGPKRKIKKITSNGRKFIRHTYPKLILEKNVVEITFDVREIKEKKASFRTKEKHIMRYWSIPEIEYFLNKNGFDLVKTSGFLNIKSKPSLKEWNMLVVARKK
jgi:SAM-dependent methyltransferase